MPVWFATLALAMLGVALLKTLVLVVLARRYHRAWAAKPAGSFGQPRVSVIVPAFNEEATLENCLRSIAAQSYPADEVVVVDDGSTDRTWAVASAATHGYPVPLLLVRKTNGGKASALNVGVDRSTSEIVVCVDADSVLEPEALSRVVRSFDDPTIGAVAGNVRVANRHSLAGWHQTVEYVSGLTLQRAAFARIGAMQVVSGALSAFRVSDLARAGGFSDETLVEDMDVTISVARTGARLVYDPTAVAWTECPRRLRDLMKQRRRWTYGGFQVLLKHRDLIGRRRAGSLGLVGLPYFLLFPWFDVAVSLMVLATTVVAVRSGNLAPYLLFLLAMCLVSGALALYLLRLDHQDPRLAVFGFLHPVFYAHVLSLATVQAGLLFALRRDVGWHKLRRVGANQVPTTSQALAASSSRPAEPAVANRSEAAEPGVIDLTDRSGGRHRAGRPGWVSSQEAAFRDG